MNALSTTRFLGLFLGLLIIPFIVYSYNQAIQVKSGVLIVHSYHKGFTWTDNIDEGIFSEIQSLEGFKNKEVFIEYMDAKRNNDSSYYAQLFKIWGLKYANLTIPVIISSDDIAFQQLIKIRPQLFPESAIVFCGVNNLADYKISLLQNQHKITGVVEGFDLHETIELALGMHPSANHVFIINDDSPTGKANKNAFFQIQKMLPENKTYTFISNFAMKDAAMLLDTLPLNSVILLLSYNKDSEGNYYSYQEAGKIICSNTNLPVYAVWDFYLGTGIVGGYLVSGKSQGKEAAFLANQILMHTPADSIAIIEKSPNRYMFDYAQLLRHSINTDSLPAGSQILGKPVTLWSKYKTEIILISIAGFLLVWSVLALLFLNRKKTKAEKNLVRSNNKLLRILETAKEGFLEINNKGIITNVNQELCTILDTEREALVHKKLADLLLKNTYENDYSKFEHCFSGVAESFELKIKTKLNQTKDLVINLSPLFSTQTKHMDGVFGLISDITYLKQNEAQLIQAKEKAERSDKLKSAFLANMSHEIRTPMNAILGFTELLAENEITEEHRAYYLEIIQKSGNNLLNLINDILDLSKIEAGEISLIINPVNINTLLNNLLITFKAHRKTLGKEFIKLKMNPLIDTLIIETDGFRLTQILSNLLNNAFKFTETGEIKFGCQLISGQELQFFVSDTGIGMPAAMQELIFERFHKIETLNNQVYRGAGLGLAISKNLVELLGGSIYCNSIEGQGTTFYFSIQTKANPN